jgi:hypothetical protein
VRDDRVLLERFIHASLIIRDTHERAISVFVTSSTPLKFFSPRQVKKVLKVDFIALDTILSDPYIWGDRGI